MGTLRGALDRAKEAGPEICALAENRHLGCGLESAIPIVYGHEKLTAGGHGTDRPMATRN